MKEIIKMINQFVAEFDIPMDISERMKACYREDQELGNAFYGAQQNEIVEESCDRVITGILNLLAFHVNPEQAIKDKIDATYAKYALRRTNETVE